MHLLLVVLLAWSLQLPVAFADPEDTPPPAPAEVAPVPDETPPPPAVATCPIRSDARSGESCECRDNKIWNNSACVACPAGQIPVAGTPSISCACREAGHVPGRDGNCIPGSLSNHYWHTPPSIVRTSQFRGDSSRAQCGTVFEIC
jgi:hypothetical protein